MHVKITSIYFNIPGRVWNSLPLTQGQTEPSNKIKKLKSIPVELLSCTVGSAHYYNKLAVAMKNSNSTNFFNSVIIPYAV